MTNFFRIGLCGVAAILAPLAAAQANSGVKLSRAVYVERVADDGQREIAPARQFRKGDTVILLVEWNAAQAGDAFTVSSPIPPSLAFKRSSLRTQSVSVDGGRNWGLIGNLRIRDEFGERLATVEDVTHLRWQIAPGNAGRKNGRITYSAIVR